MDRIQILEYTYSQALRKQRSITSLFPTFQDRVSAVAANGGVRLVGMQADNWEFSVPSGTEASKKYDVNVGFIDVENTIRHIINTNRDIWTKENTVDLRKLADILIDKVDIRWDCDCPADLYYGGKYIRTQRDAEQIGQEERPPRKRNPKQYGFACKHMENVLEAFPFYVSTMARWLKENWLGVIREEEAKINKERGFYKAAATELGKRV